MEVFLNALKIRARSMDAQVAQPRWGTVQSVNTTGSQMTVRVLFQPEGVLSGWLPVLQASASAAASSGGVPSPGDQAHVVPDLGYADHCIVDGFLHSDAAPLPAAAAANGTDGTQAATTAQRRPGEWLVTAFGSVVRLCADGSLYLRPANGKLNVDGSIFANGDVSDRHGSLNRLRGNYDNHAHGNVVNGGGTTATTDMPDPE